MRARYIICLSDGNKVDLLKMHNKDLKKLHYQEEIYVAKKTLELPPFSKERQNLLIAGYALVNKIMPWYYSVSNIGKGVEETTVRLVCKFIKTTLTPTTVYEAGVGDGYACETFLGHPNVFFRGCDIVISDKMKKIIKKNSPRVSVNNVPLYDDLLTLDNESIDIFYADNVFEHILPDEYSAVIDLLVQKLKRKSLIFLVIPNRYFGPSDVSKFFLKKGEKAQGFHFMEMTYKETIDSLIKHNLYPIYFTYRDHAGVQLIDDRFGLLNKFKFLFEKVLSYFVKERFVDEIAYRMALNLYILQKK